MRITESKLRRLVRQVIRESNQSKDWYSKWEEGTDKLNFNKVCSDCFTDLGISMEDANHFGNLHEVIPKYMNNMDSAKLKKILNNISTLSIPDDAYYDGRAESCMFTASLGLLMDKGKLKVNMDFLKNPESREIPGKDEIILIGARAGTSGDKLMTALCYVGKSNRLTTGNSGYYVISQNHNNPAIYDRKARILKNKEDEKLDREFDDRRKKIEDREREEEMEYRGHIRKEFG